MRILVVDDEKDIGHLLRRIFIQKNIQCEIAQNVKEAREKMIDQEFDKYFLDINLPDGSGFDLISGIREYNRNGEIIMISAYDGEKEQKKAKEMGVSTFISKPFTKREILNIIE